MATTKTICIDRGLLNDYGFDRKSITSETLYPAKSPSLDLTQQMQTCASVSLKIRFYNMTNKTAPLSGLAPPPSNRQHLSAGVCMEDKTEDN